MPWLVIFVVTMLPVLIVLMAGLTYNNLLLRRTKIDKSLKFVDDMLKARHQLLPKLLVMVQDRMNYDRSIIRELTEAYERSQADRMTLEQRVVCEIEIKRLVLAIFEASWNYPEIQKKKDFQQFQAEWADSEAEVNYAKKIYVRSVEQYNNTLNSLFAKIVTRYFVFDHHEDRTIGLEVRDVRTRS